MKKHILLLLILSTVLQVSAQVDEKSRALYWHFGENAGLDFSTCNNLKEIHDSPLNTVEGSASISDLDGNLLFFTRGDTVYDRNNNIMPNGTGLLGHYSSAQSALIVPHPGNPERYYIFTAAANPGSTGMRYTVVDMTLNGGFGDIVPAEKNVLLFAPCHEMLTAVRNASSTGYWVVGKSRMTSDLHAYEVTAAGVNMTPVISPGISNSAQWSLAKFSPDGNFFLNDNTGIRRVAYLYRFNNTTGQLQYLFRLSPEWSRCTNFEFSPDGTKAYTYLSNSGTIIQYDLYAGGGTQQNADTTAVQSSGISILQILLQEAMECS